MAQRVKFKLKCTLTMFCSCLRVGQDGGAFVCCLPGEAPVGWTQVGVRGCVCCCGPLALLMTILPS